MSGNPGHSRRRSSRNKTVVIDSKMMLQDTSDDTYGYERFSVLIKPKNPTVSPPSLIEARSYSFQDLMSAFHSIEKRSGQDPYYASDVLKRFKSNEETVPSSEQRDEQMRIEYEMFPKIMSNPFLRNDSDIPVDKIEKESKAKRSRHSDSLTKLNR